MAVEEGVAPAPAAAIDMEESTPFKLFVGQVSRRHLSPAPQNSTERTCVCAAWIYLCAWIHQDSPRVPRSTGADAYDSRAVEAQF